MTTQKENGVSEALDRAIQLLLHWITAELLSFGERVVFSGCGLAEPFRGLNVCLLILVEISRPWRKRRQRKLHRQQVEAKASVRVLTDICNRAEELERSSS